MLDIKLFRANPEMVKEKLAARNLETDVVDLLIDLDKKTSWATCSSRRFKSTSQ